MRRREPRSSTPAPAFLRSESRTIGRRSGLSHYHRAPAARTVDGADPVRRPLGQLTPALPPSPGAACIGPLAAPAFGLHTAPTQHPDSLSCFTRPCMAEPTTPTCQPRLRRRPCHRPSRSYPHRYAFRTSIWIRRWAGIKRCAAGGSGAAQPANFAARPARLISTNSRAQRSSA